jgi:hypothetical protein
MVVKDMPLPRLSTQGPQTGPHEDQGGNLEHTRHESMSSMMPALLLSISRQAWPLLDPMEHNDEVQGEVVCSVYHKMGGEQLFYPPVS